jgi:hypothetical protein
MNRNDYINDYIPASNSPNEKPEEVCVWRNSIDEYGREYWERCFGRKVYPLEGRRRTNGYVHCPQCGKRIKET